MAQAQAQEASSAPLIAKLEAWGYEDKASLPLASIIRKLDPQSLVLVERLSNDLTHMNEICYDLRSQVASVTDILKQERLKLEKLTSENQTLVKETTALRRDLQELRKANSNGLEKEVVDEEQVQQWRAQSMHQLQELEIMNQALRSTLNLHSCCAPPESNDVTANQPNSSSPHIALSGVLAPRSTTPPNLKARPKASKPKAIKLLNVAEMKCKLLQEELQLWKERHAALEQKMQAAQKEITTLSSTKKNEKLSECAQQSSNCRQTGNSNKQLHEGSLCDQEYLEKGMQEFLNDLEWKGKQQGIAALCTEGTNYQMLPDPMLKAVKTFKSQSASKVEGLKAKMKEIQTVLESQESMIGSLRAEILSKTDQISFIMDEKAVGEEALQASQSECNELASLMREIDTSMVQLTTALATRTIERDQESEARMKTEQELRNKYNNLLSELDRARTQITKLQSELQLSNSEQEEKRTEAGSLKAELQQCMKRMESAERDVEQLKTLIIQLDVTREELVAKLKTTMQKEQQAEKQVVSLDAEVGRLVGEVATRTTEVTHISGLLEALGKERDHLQAETSMQAEKISHLNDDNTKLEAEVRFLRRSLKSAEQRLQAAHSLLSQAEAELINLKERLSVEEATKNRLEELWTAKSTEHRSTADELANLTFAHQVICVKEKEHDELLHLYQNMCAENQQLKVAACEIENQVQQQRYHLESMEEIVHKAEDQVRSLLEENQHGQSELKAMERQADLMTRSLNQQSGLLSDYQNEKSMLLSQMSASKMAVTDLEAKLNNALRDLASAEGKNQQMSDLLQENMQEIERLSTTCIMEQERIRELEHLLACLRQEEQRLEMTSKDVVNENLMMREQLSALQDQVKNLQVTRDAQNQDLIRLQISRNRIEGEESRRFWSTAPSPTYSTQSLDSHPHQISRDIILAKTKIQQLEMKLGSVTTDLKKTTTLYKDCFSKLQKAESQFSELKKEFDQVLTLLSKVEEERIQLDQRCKELEGAAVKQRQGSGHSSPTHPEIEMMQRECHRLKKEGALPESPEIAV